jgi:hypothetical protein
VRELMAKAGDFYGAHPVHLPALLGSFALAGYSVSHLLDDPLLALMLAWFVGAVLAHDLVLFPLYALADLALVKASAKVRRVPVVNYVRVPVLGSALTFVLFFPGIIEQGKATYFTATGLTQQPYLQRWLLFVAAMFVVSAAVYAVRFARAGEPERRTRKIARSMVRPGERLLAVAAHPGTAPDAVGTTGALYFHNSDGSWTRAGWEEIFRSSWADGRLVITGFQDGSPSRSTVALPVPGDLPDLVKAEITSSLITVRNVEIEPGIHALLVASRRAGDGQVVWHVQLGEHVDRHDAGLKARAEAAIDAISGELGLGS